MSSDPTDTLGLSCPNGGHFYVCQDSDIQFLGCCTSDPCADGSGICPQEDLRYSSFDADGYKNITAQSCSGKGKWFTCAGLYTPFLGCCSSDACSYDDGCPTKSLQAAELSSNIKDAAIFETASATAESATPSTDPSVSSTMTPSTTSLASISTPANTAAPVRGSSSPGLSKGAIAGVSIACALFLIASTVALLFLRRRRWGNRKGVVGQMSESPLHTAMTRDPANSSLDHEPDHFPNTPSPVQSPTINNHIPFLAVVSKSPTQNSSRANSVRSWFSKASRKASMSSASYNNQAQLPQSPTPSSWQGLAVSPTTPREDIEQQQQQCQPFISHSEPLETVAELEGTAISRPPSELPGDTQPHSPTGYRPYRPTVGSVWI